MSELVSVIMPMYNSEAYVLEAIKSVINQTYLNWELIIVDDCSADNSVQIVSDLSKIDSRIILLKNTINSGAAISRNKAINFSNGNFMAFLDSDDLWLPKKLQIQLEALKKHNASVCFTSYEQIDSQGNKLNILVEALPKLSYNKLLKSNYIGNLTGIYSVKSLGKITSPNLRKRQDWLLWLKAVKSSEEPAIGVQETLALYRVRPNSISSNKINLLKYNYRVYKKD